MRWDQIDTMRCSVARALSVIGDRWTMLILRDAFLGLRRFEQFQHDLGLTRHRLSERLRKLVRHRILRRVVYQTRPRRFEYRLTDKGLDLYPVLVALLGWGDKWMAAGKGPPIELVHRSCGKAITPKLTCPECAEPIDARAMRPRSGPALRNALFSKLGPG